MEIIAEIGINWEGRFNTFEELIRKSKMGGADWIKFQLYSSEKLFGNWSRKKYEISFKELQELDNICKFYNIDWFASVFDKERLNWCEELKRERYKISSRTFKYNSYLVESILHLEKLTYISLNIENKFEITYNLSFPITEKTKFLNCISEYPTKFNKINKKLFCFDNNRIGISDHSIGISRCLYAISKGAKVIEKHFSLNKMSSDSHDHIGSMDYKELCILNTYGRELSNLHKEINK